MIPKDWNELSVLIVAISVFLQGITIWHLKNRVDAIELRVTKLEQVCK